MWHLLHGSRWCLSLVPRPPSAFCRPVSLPVRLLVLPTFLPYAFFRRHEEWGGFNHFFLGGKVMMGSDVRWFVSSNITLTLPSIFFVWEMFSG